jgi:PRTRC genetic system protein C
MALEITNLARSFSFKKDGKTISLPDPNPALAVDEVMGFYSSQYSELTTSTVDGPKVDGNKAVYEFKTTVGTKG